MGWGAKTLDRAEPFGLRFVSLMRMAAVGATFFVVAKLCHWVALEGSTVTPVWFPSGIAFTAVLLAGRSVLPALWIAAVAAATTGIMGSEMTATMPEILIVSGLIACGSTLEPVVGVRLFRVVVPSADPFESVRALVWLSAAAGCIACAVSATIAIPALGFAGLVAPADLGLNWLTWWIGNTVGVILVAPLLIAWQHPPHWIRDSRTLLPGLAIQAGVVLASIAIFRLPVDGAAALVITFAIIPLIVWSSYARGPHGATLSVAIFALSAVIHTAKGMGPFVGVSLNESLLLSQICIGIVATTGLSMSAASAQRRRLETATHVLSSELAQAGRVSLTSELAAGVAHEVHQPLGVISNYANSCMIRLRDPNCEADDLFEPLGRIVSETARAAEAVRGIRRLLNHVPPREELLDIGDLVHDSIAVIKAYGTASHTDMRSYVADPLPEIRGDATQIMQVLTNLLVNATDALAGAGVSEPFVAVHVAPYHEGVAVTVSDNGPGMGSEALSLCLDRFYTTKPGGLGMGLPICRTIVEHHGGELSVDSSPGRGTTFRFTLAPRPLTLTPPE